MGYFVRVGSTSPPSPAQTIDQVDDEALAVEMVRVVEEAHATAWATVLPVLTLPEGAARSSPAALELAQQEYDDRDDEVRAKAAEVRTEALRRLGRATDDDVPSAADPDGPARPAATPDSDIEREPRRKRVHRVSLFRGRRHSEPMQARQADDDEDHNELATEASEREADAVRQTDWRPDSAEALSAAEHDHPTDAPPTADHPKTPTDTQHRKLVVTTTIFETPNHVEPRQAQQDTEDREHDEPLTEAAEVSVNAVGRASYPPDGDTPPMVERDQRAGLSSTADPPETEARQHDAESMSPAGDIDRTTDEPKTHRKRGPRLPTFRARRNPDPPLAPREHHEQERDEVQVEAADTKTGVLDLRDQRPNAAGRAAEMVTGPEKRRNRGHRVPTLQERRHFEPSQDKQPLNDQDDNEPQREAAEVEANAAPQPGGRPDDETPSKTERGHVADAPPPADRSDPTPDTGDREPVATPTSAKDCTAETTVEPEQHRKRGHRGPAFRTRRLSKPVDDRRSVETLNTASPQGVQSSEGASEIHQRITQYALDDRRRPGYDRRSFVDRRQAQGGGFDRSSERRTSGGRRSGTDRRRAII